MNKYYQLKKGDKIIPGDEVEVSNGYNEVSKWVKAQNSIGLSAPDPSFISHRRYRRNISHIDIKYSNGRGRSGQQYAFIRPAYKCFNRSRRCRVDQIGNVIAKHFPVVNYYKIDGHVIGAKNEEFALREYWRVCAMEDCKAKTRFLVEPLTCDHPKDSEIVHPGGFTSCAKCGASEI